MKIPNHECVNFWGNCEDCAYTHYINCPKIIRERAELKQVADETEKRSIKKAHEDAQRLIKKYDSTPQKLIKADSETFWLWWSASSPIDPQNITREPIMAMSGAIVFNGGGSSGRKGKNKPKKTPEYLKTWGI